MARVSAEFINQKSPYKVIQVDDLSVRFITTSGVKYLVGFTPDSFIFDEGGYDFFIINESETAIQDHLVFETIIAVIESLFADTNNSAMIYICSPYDNRQNARARMFEMFPPIPYHLKRHIVIGTIGLINNQGIPFLSSYTSLAVK